ncbi:MAG: HAD-IIB family hydrolase [Kiritimatiellia bacterium]|jgi:HAD superfamily hydrolase (TIGR01484 family)
MRLLFCDIDDTMTTDGFLPREAFNALWDAHEAGLRVVPVTGRPAGWCDHIARMWPIDGVIGENGAFYFRRVKFGIRRIHSQSPRTRATNRRKLKAIEREVLEKVPGSAVSADQPYREYDLAIDYCEDVKRLSRKSVRHIVEIFKAHGAQAKVSSIHVNGWFGDFDKLTMARQYIKDVDNADLETDAANYAFVGDSPNDEPMFAAFPVTFGVANIEPFLDDLKHKPTCITQASGGAGFAEVVEMLIAGRDQTEQPKRRRARR